jgi:hypothetical protein
MQRTGFSPERAVIVGNGSSVDAMPPAFWRACQQPGTVLVGTNRVLCFRRLQDVAFDALVIRDTYRNLWHDQAVGIRYHEELWKPAACWKVGPADRRVTHCDEFVRFAPGWQHRRVVDANGEAAVMMQSSVVLMAANWAWLEGARELYLIGVDYCGPHAEMIEPYGGRSVGWEGQYDKPVPEAIVRQFGQAVSAVRRLGGRILNLSANSSLQAVPPADWHEALPA